MANTYFQFKQFRIEQSHAAMKVGTDGVTLGAWVKCENAFRILDIGAGTALVSIMLAQRSRAQIDAVELDSDACIDASLNIANCRWHDRIKLYNQSIQNYACSEVGLYDCIVCNPPYFNGSFQSDCENRNVARHNLNLDLKELFRIAFKLLTDEGSFSIVYPTSNLNQVESEAMLVGLHLQELILLKPTPQKPSKRFVASFTKKNVVAHRTEMVIEEGGRHQYSQEYINMVRDFYLKY